MVVLLLLIARVGDEGLAGWGSVVSCSIFADEYGRASGLGTGVVESESESE